MAIYYLDIGHVSRSTGRSSVQSAAYITGSKLYESRRDLTANYENRHSDIACTQTLAPDYAPDEFKELSVWNKIESFEDDYAIERYPHNIAYREKYQDSARTAMTIVVAIPKELSVESAKELVEEFAKDKFVARGLIVTYALHDDEGNPHAHLQISRRSVDEKGNFSWAKNQDMCTKRELFITRKYWADLTNQYLERDGFEVRITEKSYADLGVKLSPMQHRGWFADKLAGMGIQSRLVLENEKTFDKNKNTILEDPETILNEMTSKQATFTQIQLLTAIQKRIGDDSSLVSQVFETVLEKAIVLGEGIDGHIRYTSSLYKEKEASALQSLDQMLQSSSHPGIKNFRVDAFLSERYGKLSEEQREAVVGLIKDSNLSVLIGRAGSGKTTTLKAVSEIYQKSGFTVIGTSLSALASENLGNEAGIKAKTITSWLAGWDRYREAEEKFLSFDKIVDEGALKQLGWYQDLKRFEKSKLTNKSVVIVDEAGMVGTRQWGDLLMHAERAGAKVIAVGDDHQFKAIEAGDFFRELKEKAEASHQLYALQTIRRQNAEWMRQASHCLAELKSQEGLSLYEQKGHVHQTDAIHLEQEIADVYLSKLKDGKEGLVLASTNAQTEMLNQVIRDKLRQQELPGHLLSSKDVLTLGEKGFALGDKVVFLKNDKTAIRIVNSPVSNSESLASGIFNFRQVNSNNQTQKQNHKQNNKQNHNLASRFITNGTTGILEHVSENGEEVVVKLDENTKAYFNIKDYKALSHGYALTAHKSQGQTVDFTLIAASRNLDAKGAYVALTRHRDDVQLFYTKEDFSDFKALALHLSRFDNKDLVKDYTIRPEHEKAWTRVQEYRHCVFDAAVIKKVSAAEGDSDWAAYNAVKKDQIVLGKEILTDFEGHKLYLHQAGLTQEMLHITMGLKPRPLSFAEEKAKLTVEIYCETAQLTRSLWHEVRKTTPSTQHPKYGQFQSFREERDALAKQMLDNYPLYREFVKGYSKEYGITKKTLENQVAYRNKSREEIQKESLTKQSLPPHLSFSPELALNPSVSKAIQTIESLFTEDLPVKEDGVAKENRIVKDRFAGKSSGNKSGQAQSKQQALISSPSSFSSLSSPSPFAYAKSSAEIAQDLNAHIKDLALHFLGKPSQQNAREWRYGKKGSLAIQVNGTKQGLYSNFETGISGNAITLISEQLGLDKKEAFKWGVDWLGESGSLTLTASSSRHQRSTLALTQSLSSKTIESDTWKPVFPAPEAFPDLKNTPQLRSMLKGRHESERYAYKDAEGHILGYVVRLEDLAGNKITPPLTYCRNEKGIEQWRWKGFEENRSLYGLDQLKQHPDRPVLVVEGEKTCEAARKLFPDHVVMTWSGGCGSVQKSDWSVLKDRTVTIWPDHDKTGLNAAFKIGDILKDQDNNPDNNHGNNHGYNKIRCVDLPSRLPHKWDLADKIPEGLSIEDLLQKALAPSELKRTLQEQREPQVPRYTKTFSYAEIHAHAERNGSAYLISEDNAPFMEHIANEACKEIKEWCAITNTEYSEKSIHLQASLTSLYTTRIKELLEQEKDPQSLKKALAIGTIAGKMRMTTKFKDDYVCIRQATDRYQEIESKIQQQMMMHSPLLKQCSLPIKEEIIRATYRCHTITGKALSTETLHDFVKGLEHACPIETNHRNIIGVINRVREIKANNITSMTPELLHHAIENQKHQDMLLLKSVQMSKDKALQIEHQRELQRERGFEMSL
jgi:ATP-dependent exoDNAse (exonuclease V) alpha subunit